MRNTTTTVVIAAGAVLAAVIVTRTPAQQGRMAAGAGDPCPADIDNDAMVGINDFLILLGDWGPCPTPKVVAVATWLEHEAKWVARLWSSGLVEIRSFDVSACWDCPDSAPRPFTWVDYGTPAPPSPDAKPVDVEWGESGFLVVAFSDGTVYQTTFHATSVGPCDGEEVDMCVLDAHIWKPLP